MSPEAPHRRTWRDAAEIARDLLEAHPGTEPLSVPLPQLRMLVARLPLFADDPAAATDSDLETIQAAWYDAYEG